MGDSVQTQSSLAQHSVLRDVYLGVVLGDFAQEIGGAGRLAQVILGFVPVIGSVGALRDAVADWQQRDMVGVVLNILATIPAVGGVAKIAAVARATRRMARALRAARALNAQTPAQRR